MAKYLLAAHSVDNAPRPDMSPEDMQATTERVMALEDEMRHKGVFVFGGALHPADTATVVRATDGEVLHTDGPFVEAKEHLGGIYLIEAADLDDALHWAARTSELVGAPIEVRPFAHVSEA